METINPFRLPRVTPFGVGENIAEWATGLSKLGKYYHQRPAGCSTEEFLRFTLEVLGIDYQISRGSLDNIPKCGATVVVANHPLGCVEGVILAELLLMIRKDIKILANQYLKTVPELEKLFIGVDVFDSESAHKSNMKALRDANRHLEEGGMLLMFPAGEVSHLVGEKQPRQKKKQRLEDKDWNRSVSMLIHKHKAATVPVYIDGANSKPFYLAAKIHPMLRTLMLGRELLNKQSTEIGLSIGDVIKYKEIKQLSNTQLVNYLRLNTYLLNRHDQSPLSVHSDQESELLPVANPLPINEILDDINRLPESDHLLSSGEFDVYCTSADNIPSLLHEIGRMREVNFRAVGEGTGLAIDIDEFDRDYQHLFVWNREKNNLVGAYRLGFIDKLIEKKGLGGLYSRTLFDYDDDFLKTMGKSIEMGRSVIAQEYQRSMSALLLLWKGIATYVSNNPDYTHLFGPVSISNDYSDHARKLLIDTIKLHYYDADSSEYVKPTNPWPTSDNDWNRQQLSALDDLQLLSRVISRLDKGKTVPVLLRQYLSLNGKIVSFNIDPNFNNALDGLIVVDLRDVEPKTLARYMGVGQAYRYLEYHRDGFEDLSLVG